MRCLRLVALMCVFAAGTANATTITYNDRPTFLSTLGSSVTDDYSGYGLPATGSPYSLVLSDAAMSAVFGQTQYVTTGYLNHNIITQNSLSSPDYCAGCNGSFRLVFTGTTVGTSNGVFGVGLDVVVNPYTEYAFVTFGDDHTQEFSLSGPGFFGITDPLGIKSIHFGETNGVATKSSLYQFGIDNLTVGGPSTEPPPAVPEPTSLVLLGTGLVGIAGRAWRKRRG